MSTEVNRRILLVDDNEAIHEDYKKILVASDDSSGLDEMESIIFGEAEKEASIKYEVDSAFQGQDGVALAKEAREQGRPYAMAFVDMRMPPGIDGLQTIQQIWEEDPELQVVICTAYSDYSAYQIIDSVGETDQLLFLRKPFDNAEVCLMARTLTAKWNLARRARLRMAQLETLVHEHTAELRKEVIERRAAQDRLQHAAFHDTLTGLYNRAFLMDRLQLCMDRQTREDDYQFAVLFLDLDNFKLINDSLGHDVGDELLIAIADRLRKAVRVMDAVSHGVEDTTARLGGDEFIVLLDGIASMSDAVAVADRVQELLNQPFDLRGQETTITASIGIAAATGKCTRPEDVLRDADTAMYRAKGTGKARHAIFDEGLHAEALERLRLENDIRRSIDHDGFHLVYQPIVDPENGQIAGFEALLRWTHAERGDVPPDDFIPVMEEMGVLVDITRWVLEHACTDLKSWIDTVPRRSDLYVSVNLSHRQITADSLSDMVAEILMNTGLAPQNLGIEITETSLVDETEQVSAAVRGLRESGVRVLLDDFGTGLSSLSCLHQMPIDVLKIDRSFIMRMQDQKEYAAIVHAVLTLASHMNLQVVAEGVETEQQMQELRRLGCHYIQGFHVSRSLSRDQVVEVIRSGLNWRSAA